ncbi:MAG: DUF2634 domain-containing protein [Cellulosilyticaceae bacterium]
MSLFPFISDDDTKDLTLNQPKIPVEYEYDFKNKRLTGNKVEGIEAIKIWILKALKVERYQYLIYSQDYGVEIENYIGKNYDGGLMACDVATNIEEALKINPYIKGIEEFESTFNEGRLTCKFKVITDFGEVTIDV